MFDYDFASWSNSHFSFVRTTLAFPLISLVNASSWSFVPSHTNTNGKSVRLCLLSRKKCHPANHCGLLPCKYWIYCRFSSCNLATTLWQYCRGHTSQGSLFLSLVTISTSWILKHSTTACYIRHTRFISLFVSVGSWWALQVLAQPTLQRATG